MILLWWRDLRPKHQLYQVALSTNIRVYLKPPTDMQSPNAMPMWTTSRYFKGDWSIDLPQGAFGIVVYVPIETGNLPLSMHLPSLVTEIRCL